MLGTLLCKIGFHSWYSNFFQTGELSEFTGDHVGVAGRVCLDCDKKQIYRNGKYEATDSFKKKKGG